MKVAVNARWLIPGKLEGTGIYTLKMLQQIILAFPEHIFFLLLDRKVEFDSLGLNFSNVNFIVVSPMARHPILWKVWNDFSVPKKLKTIGADLYWSPDGFPAQTPITQWITIHDLNFEHHPEWIKRNVAKYYRKNIRRGARIAAKLFTVSNWSKNDIVSSYGISKEKIIVTPNAPQREFSPGKSRFTKNYFCAVGAIAPRKNLITLIQAFDRWCSQNTEQKHTLKIAGTELFKDLDFQYDLQRLNHSSRIEWLGRLNDNDLEMLYRGATAYCMPSAMEGFGIPLVEAMQCGTPIIASKNSAIIEVVGEAGLLLPTYNVDAWTEGLQKMISEYDHWSQLSLKRGDDFDWEKSAQPFIDALKE
ncbi:MAG: glycosyltransferase family 1 protein [Bacteroidota bacterium]|nr:glycosyltransferase family 1 protein [Bacteroidota bacterium]